MKNFKKNFVRMTKGDMVFDVFNIVFLALIAFSTLYPFWYVAVKSVMPFSEVIQTKLVTFPRSFTFESFKYVFSTERLIRGVSISALFTIAATLWQLFCTALTAYALTKNDLPGRNIFFNFIIFTMFFGGGLIPTYLLIRDLHLMDSYLALILPATVGTYNMIIIKTFFLGLPDSLEESARIDGASYFKIYLRIILPLSTPVMATIALFLSVGHWNSWYGPLLYLNDSQKWPLALILRQILIKTDVETLASSYVSENYMLSEQIKMAIVMVSIVPIIIVYPFLQKYFVKGIMVGAVKA